MRLIVYDPLHIKALLLQMATIYVPLCNSIFKIQPLTATELAATLAVSSIIFVVAVEIKKLIKRRNRRNASA